jgi:hypothetical protein
MVIGTCIIDLEITDSDSLKDKRQVVKSLMERVRHRFPVSVAQLDDHDLWHSATLGIAVVANQTTYANQVLNKLLDYVESDPRVMVVACQMEML